MPGKNRNRNIWVLTCLILVLSGCYSNKTYYGFLPQPRDIPVSITGSWIRVQMDPSQEQTLTVPDHEGELIAVEGDSVVILQKDSLCKIAVGQIGKAELIVFRNQWGKVTGEASLFLVPPFIGLVGTGTYGGFFLPLMVPVILAGAITSALEGIYSTASLVYPSKIGIDQLRIYARFPQGLPDGLDVRELKLIPVGR